MTVRVEERSVVIIVDGDVLSRPDPLHELLIRNHTHRRIALEQFLEVFPHNRPVVISASGLHSQTGTG